MVVLGTIVPGIFLAGFPELKVLVFVLLARDVLLPFAAPTVRPFVVVGTIVGMTFCASSMTVMPGSRVSQSIPSSAE